MASFKVRRKALLTGQFQMGGGGTAISEILTGSVSIICPSAAASSLGLVTTATVTGLDATAMLFVTCGSLDANMALKSAKASAGTISACWANVGGADVSGSTRISLQYLAVTPV